MTGEDWRIVADRLRDQLDSLAVREEQQRRNALRFGDTNYPGGHAGDWPDHPDMTTTTSDTTSADTTSADTTSREND